ncbi:MAG TPA: ATP-binding cassette domain-containing protein [Pseudonocardiaceae bacterium]|nr:ATP-binding cassette domain-containing protein [Pseudonocardiaceae bacterium]
MPPTPAIEAHGLSKSYESIIALRDLNLTINEGEIYGLVGRNGAGKTTFMRLLLGLLRPSSGTVRVLNRTAGDPAALIEVGSLVESPAMYPHLTGRDNLLLLAHYCRSSTDDVASALARVDLTDRADSKFRSYSLGMKQRLGVAAALLGDPRLLILDEPTNGLDPGAMVKMRDLLRELRERGRTILLSSHLLGEIEQVCDRIGVIHDGKLIIEGDLATVKSTAGQRLLLNANPLTDALALLQRFTGLGECRIVGDEIEVALETATPAQINRMLVTADIEVNELRLERRSLEDVFLGLTDDATIKESA